MAIQTYTVRPGDSLSKIAQKLGLKSWQDLYNLNKSVVGSNPDLIYSGQVLKIPGASTAPVTPAPTPQPAVPVSQQYTQAGVEQVNRAAEIPQFEDAMGTFKQLWESRFRDPINTAAQYQVRPEFTRAYNEANYDYMNQMGSAGGQRLGRGRMGLGNLKAASNRAYLATLGDWVDQQRQNLYSKWYEPTAEDWNTAKLQANFNKDDYAIPTWEEGLEKYGSAFGAGITPGLFS
jgi:LysM repeat protein